MFRILIGVVTGVFTVCGGALMFAAAAWQLSNNDVTMTVVGGAAGAFVSLVVLMKFINILLGE